LAFPFYSPFSFKDSKEKGHNLAGNYVSFTLAIFIIPENSRCDLVWEHFFLFFSGGHEKAPDQSKSGAFQGSEMDGSSNPANNFQGDVYVRLG
jgi:hypothetical protein